MTIDPCGLCIARLLITMRLLFYVGLPSSSTTSGRVIPPLKPASASLYLGDGSSPLYRLEARSDSGPPRFYPRPRCFRLSGSAA